MPFANAAAFDRVRYPARGAKGGGDGALRLALLCFLPWAAGAYVVQTRCCCSRPKCHAGEGRHAGPCAPVTVSSA